MPATSSTARHLREAMRAQRASAEQARTPPSSDAARIAGQQHHDAIDRDVKELEERNGGPLRAEQTAELEREDHAREQHAADARDQRQAERDTRERGRELDLGLERD